MPTQAAATGAIAGLLVMIVLAAGWPTPLAQLLAAASILVMAGHAVLALGWTEAALFAAICLVVTVALENLGLGTGLIFGDYNFNVGRELPHLGLVPLIVGPLYFGMGYPSWIIAGLLLGPPGSRIRDRLRLFGQPIIAAFAMVQWDAVLDPAGSTETGAWFWHRGGGYFGVPLSNYVGWFVTTWLFFQLTALVLYRRRHLAPYSVRSRLFWLVPVLFYLAAGLSHVPPFLAGGTVSIEDGGGRVWSIADLHETTMVVLLATMLPTAILAMLRLFDGTAAPGRDPE